MQIKTVNRLVIYTVLNYSVFKAFFCLADNFLPTESKYGRVFELVLVSGSELSSCEWTWPRSSSHGFHLFI